MPCSLLRRLLRCVGVYQLYYLRRG
eukprot:COSAG02_NODE_47110_length_343_cov_1.262295_1_plen_24_part_10